MPFPVEWYRDLGVLNSPTTIRWQDENGGDEFIFTGSPDNPRSGIFVLNGATGLSLPPAEHASTDYAAQDGAFLNGARSASRDITIPLYVWGVNRQEYLRLENALAETMEPGLKRRLVIEDKTFPRVRSRYIECYYADGWEGDESEDSSGLTWRRIPLELYCPDPWFREDGQETYTFSADQDTITIPELLGGTAWPTFHLQLPYGAENPVITNLTTGKFIRLEMVSGAVLTGEDGEELVLGDDEGFEPDIVEISTAPKARWIRRNDAIAWDIRDHSSSWLSVKSGHEVSISVEELEEYPGWTALMILNPYHRKGL